MASDDRAWVGGQAFLLALYFFVPRWPRAEAGLWLGLIGLAALAAGAGLGLWALAQLGRDLTPFPTPKSGTGLRTTGAFAVVRHPAYTGLALAALGWAVWRYDAARLLVAAMLCVFLDRKARREETLLRAAFPDYDAYAARVKRFVPGVY